MTTIGTSDATIHTFVPVPINTSRYRKTLIAKLFVRQILIHATLPSISISDLVTTVASYFDMSTAMTEREAKTAAESIYDSIFRVTNMTRVNFLDSKEKPVAITDPSRRLDDITYFTFRANINPHLVDTRAPDSVHLFEFSLRLAHAFPSSLSSLSVHNSTSNNNTPALVDTFDYTLSKISEEDFQTISASQMRQLISDKRNYLLASGSLNVS